MGIKKPANNKTMPKNLQNNKFQHEHKTPKKNSPAFNTKK